MEITKRRLLVIDDDKIVGKIVKQRFESNGYEVEVEEDPLEALATIKKFSPDIVLLDVVMPGLSGFALLAEIRTIYSTLELPIIMMTAKSGDDEIVHALELGANDYLVKPFNIKVGIARVELQLKAIEATMRQLELQEYQTISSMIATYNHEINNPLAIAMGYLDRGYDRIEKGHIKKVKEALERIHEIILKINHLTDNSEITKVRYIDNVDMVNLKD